MKRLLLNLTGAMVCGMAGTALASPFSASVDLDTTRLSGSNISGPLSTQPGFTSWNVTTLATSGNTLSLDGVTFELFGFSAANQSRFRTAGGGGGLYDALLTDLVYNEGGQLRAIGLRISGLELGMYEMSSWHYDSDPSVTSTENWMKIEVRNQNDTPSTVIVASKQPFGTEPVSFSFNVTALGQVKEIIFREDDDTLGIDPIDQNRSRLNGFTISYVPEPSSLSLLLLGAGAFALRRRSR